eukprot:m.191140 g.191140  ORF g.191140 m.191140 type:complete len:97 (-) comp18584_c0_seq11:203-493(-)
MVKLLTSNSLQPDCADDAFHVPLCVAMAADELAVLCIHVAAVLLDVPSALHLREYLAKLCPSACTGNPAVVDRYGEQLLAFYDYKTQGNRQSLLLL